MSTTYRYLFTRHLKHGKTSVPASVTGMTAMTTEAYTSMVAAPWVSSAVAVAGLPVHNYLQSGFSESFDAAKYCGDWAAGREHAYACAVCYTVQVPLEALAGTVAKLESVAATVHGDRWLAEGAIVSVHLSASPMPPAWADVLAATYQTNPADEALLPPLSPATRSNEGPDYTTNLTLPIGVAGVNAMRYVHVVLRLADYISVPQITIVGVGTKDSAWIEGGAMLDGATLALTFDREVAADSNTIVLSNNFAAGNLYSGGAWIGSTLALNFAHSAGITFAKDPALCPASQPGNAAMMRQILNGRNSAALAPWWKHGTTNTGFGVNGDFATKPGKIGVVYSSLESFDVYHMSGLTVVRCTETNGGLANGISFNIAVPTLPAGQIVRFAFYGKNGAIPSVPLPLGVQRVYRGTVMEEIKESFLLGTSTTFNLYAIDSGPYFYSAATYPTAEIYPMALQPLGHYDVSGAGIAAGTVLPFTAPWKLPSHAVIVATANVIGYTDDWVPAVKTSTAVAWEPDDITLHLA